MAYRRNPVLELLGNAAPVVGSIAGTIAGGALGAAGGPLAPLTMAGGASLGAGLGGGLGQLVNLGVDSFQDEDANRAETEEAQALAKSQEAELKRLAQQEALSRVLTPYL